MREGAAAVVLATEAGGLHQEGTGQGEKGAMRERGNERGICRTS